MRNLFPALVFLWFPILSDAQPEIKVIMDNHDHQPVEGVIVFQESTSNFAFSDPVGRVKFAPLKQANDEIIISHLNYKNKMINAGSWNLIDTIWLDFQPVNIEEVLVRAQRSNKRKRWMKAFEEGLLGKTKNSDKTRIINPDALLFSEDEKGNISAISTDLLKIENDAMGYEILFLLEDYTQAPSGKVQYKGKPIFSEMEARSEKHGRKWEEEREKTYKLSLRHILTQLASGSEPENVDIFIAVLSQGSEFLKAGKPDIGDLLAFDGNNYELRVERFLAFENKNIRVRGKQLGRQNISGLSRPAEREMAMQTMNEIELETGNATTFIYSRSRVLKFNKRGIILNPEHIAYYGYHGTWGLSDLLPQEYPQLPGLFQK